MFFGAGGLYFNKPPAQYSILNDLDDDVYNLWRVYQTDCDKLLDELKATPKSNSIFKYFRKNVPTDLIKKAVRFLILSNFGYMGKDSTLMFGCGNPTKSIIERSLVKFAEGSSFMCEDFRNVLKKINKRDLNKSAFIYADPPYLATTNNYQHSFKQQDMEDLFELLVNSNCNFAISEFDNPIVLDLAAKYTLNVIIIGERQNLKNRRTEILITNYDLNAI